jgi:hypothetical protein
LAHAVADRYTSAEEFAEALRGELARLGFEDPKRELAEYLVDPAGYAQAYEARIVLRLCERGRRARKERNATLAASDFNRALAFRPADVELLAQVAGLARAQRLRRTSLRLLAVASGSVALGLVAYTVAGRFQPRVDSVVPPAIERAPVTAEAPNPLTRPNDRPRPSRSAAPHAATTKPPRAQGHKPRPVAADPQPSRKVKLVQARDGIPPGLVKIDGVEKRDWLRTSYLVPVGMHRFEFFPPDDKCCDGPRVEHIEIVAGDNPDDPQLVKAYVEPKPATLLFRGPEGAVLSCQGLGKFAPDRAREFRNISLKTVPCTVFPPQSSGEEPREVPVELRAGQVSTVSWP